MSGRGRRGQRGGNSQQTRGGRKMTLDERFTKCMERFAKGRVDNKRKSVGDARSTSVRGNNKKSKSVQGKAKKTKTPTSEDLDKELDNFMGRDHSEAAKEDLDRELDDYYGSSGPAEESVETSA